MIYNYGCNREIMDDVKRGAFVKRRHRLWWRVIFDR